ncbi:hypothetical protein B0H11DRAFT_2225318 [Mycena galericulata]|nr:hypothetical protein B0H11DRAFT_2230745 [Mycena galericulata]KAJ7500929.1 hypothetical protein B0H11DRAFT_2225318 [Mycena galericulata]
MTDHSVAPAATNASNPQEELDALVQRIVELSQMSLDMTPVVPGIALSRQAFDMARACLDLRTIVPEVFARVAGVPADETAPAAIDWVEEEAPTPDQMEQYFPPGLGDDLAWHVVCVGRETGLFQSAEEADKQIRGVPNQFRQKKDSRVEALAFYRLRYETGRVHQMVAIPIESATTALAAPAAAKN